MAKTFDHLESPISYDASARTTVDRAFERRRGRGVGRTFERPSTSRPWLVWLLVGAGSLALLAFSVWPGAGISRDASRTAVGSDAVWNGVIRQTGRVAPGRKPASIEPARVQLAAAAAAPVRPAPARPAIKTIAMAEPAAASVASQAPVEPPAPSLGDPTVLSIQGLLKRAGYEPGPIDGVIGNRTRGAVMAWQLDQGLPVDGEPGAQVLQGLLDPVAAASPADRLSIKSISLHEREALESWCSSQRTQADQLAYYRCLEDQIQALANGFRLPKPDSPGMSVQTVNFARANCTNELSRGPQTYFQCVNARARLASDTVEQTEDVTLPAATGQPVAKLD